MRNVIAVLAVILLAAGGCIKNDTPSCSAVTKAAPASEVDSLQAYLTSKSIIATKDNRGFFYTIVPGGSTNTAQPSVCSDVSVTYTLALTNGQIVDSSGENTPISLGLSATIIGWQEAIPLMKTNDAMTLYLPPSLAYGSTGSGPIPANANLVFTVKLFAFN